MIDWTRVAELKDEIGEEDFADVVALFLEEVGEVVARLRSTPAPDQDRAQLERDMHFLKGSALNLGFAELARLCAAAEKAAAGGAAVVVAPVLACHDASRARFLEDSGLAVQGLG